MKIIFLNVGNSLAGKTLKTFDSTWLYKLELLYYSLFEKIHYYRGNSISTQSTSENMIESNFGVEILFSVVPFGTNT